MSYEPLRKAPQQPSTQKHNTQPRHRSTGSKSRYSVPQTTDEARHASFASSAPLAHSSEEPTKPAHSETLPGGFIAGTPPEQTESLPFRARMESAFGRNLGFVHVRTGAADAMRSIGAQAAAFHDQIAFAEARPGPWIVAHELAHVFQQHHAGGPSLRLRSCPSSVVRMRPGWTARSAASRWTSSPWPRAPATSPRSCPTPISTPAIKFLVTRDRRYLRRELGARLLTGPTSRRQRHARMDRGQDSFL